MDKWHNQFDKLRKQWSNYAWLDTDYKLHSKKHVAKIGVAWVVKTPGAEFEEPVGWEVEIIDTPVGISERSHSLLKWLKSPPHHLYDTISSYDDLSNPMFDELYDDTIENRRRSKYIRFFPRDEPGETFSIPPNEYEIFKKSCCLCKERSFKNTSTTYESDMTTNRQHVPYKLTAKTSHFGINHDENNTEYIFKSDKKLNTDADHDIHSGIEKEINNYVIDDSVRSSISRPRRPDHGEHSKTDEIKPSVLVERSIGTSRVPPIAEGDERHHGRKQSRRSRASSLIDQGTPGHHHYHRNHNRHNHDIKTFGDRRVHNGNNHVGVPHIPTMDVFGDDVMTRGASLGDYRNTEHNIFNRKPDDNEFRKQNRNGHHKILKDEQDMDIMTKINYVPSDLDNGTTMVDEEPGIHKESLGFRDNVDF
ncbi:hypothetical protein HHI36_009639 [Cryptolaemus montrouzieri]|uniref:Uncharacterized protein n=1 Tax=Cryptolaemus montrouzieri TaxID=559131 RepID=A0ABD2MH38_9CUCU